MVQVVAYNKMDVPDASDYWPDMRELLQQEGVDAEDIVSVSAVSGQGVPELVRRVRARLEELPNEVRTGQKTHVHLDTVSVSAI